MTVNYSWRNGRRWISTAVLISSMLIMVVWAGQAGAAVNQGGTKYPQTPSGEGTTTRVNVDSEGNQCDEQWWWSDSPPPSISADGQVIPFMTTCRWDPNDGLHEDIYVHDRKTKQTTLASKIDSYDGYTWASVISADGRLVVFENECYSFDYQCLAYHDRETGITNYVIKNGLSGPDEAAGPDLSADGLYLVYSAFITEPWGSKIYVYNFETKTESLISATSTGTPANSDSYDPAISDDGRFVAFRSSATDIVSNDGLGIDIYVTDRETKQTTLISKSSSGSQGNGGSYTRPAISADGRFVAFDSLASNLVEGDTAICQDPIFPQENGNCQDIFVHDRQTGETTRVSIGWNGEQANGNSSYPAISADGRYVAFESTADNLVAGDTNEKMDVFVYDRQKGLTRRVSVDSAGSQGNGDSRYPSLSANGKNVVFTSEASNLVTGDTNDNWDVFVHDWNGNESGSAPVAVNDSFTGTEDVKLSVSAPGLLSNDSDSDGDTLVAALVKDAAHGQVALKANGSFSYLPEANFNGSDSFTYAASDGVYTSDFANVFIEIDPVNDPPVAEDLSITTYEDINVNFHLPVVDVDKDQLSYQIVTGPEHGLLNPNADPSEYTYSPDLNFSGTDSFVYKANDGQSDSNMAVVSIKIILVNHPPVVENQTIYTDRNVPATITLTANDADQDALTFKILQGPKHGDLSGAGPNLTYTPVTEFVGGDSFTYVANDGQVDSNQAKVIIYILPVYDRPVPLPENPFQLPDPSDSTYVIDKGTRLDQFFFADEGAIEFNMYIDRLVGYTEPGGQLYDPDLLIANGVLSPKATLLLSVFDVDEDYPGSNVGPEIDRVFVNDHEVGRLQGADGQWSLNRFEIDVRDLKFGFSPCWLYYSEKFNYLSICPDKPWAGRNTIRIEIDTENYEPHWKNRVWGVAVGFAAISFEAARPILFVHGRGGSGKGSTGCFTSGTGEGCEYWDADDKVYYFGFRQLFDNAGFLGSITENFLNGEGSMDKNAQQLDWIVDAMLIRYGVDKINIVAHSKGGLDSRAYISNSEYNKQDAVAALVTLATPHHGSYLADFAMSKPDWLVEMFGRENSPAMENLTEHYMNSVFNPNHPAQENVQYYSIFSDASRATKCSKLFYDYHCPDPNQLAAIPPSKGKNADKAYDKLFRDGTYLGRNDFSVTVSSARMKAQPAAGFAAIPGHNDHNTQELGPYFLNHHSIRAALRFKYEKDTTIADLVMDLLDIRPDSGVSSAPQPLLTTKPTSGENGSTFGLEYGILSAGETVTIPVGIGSTPDMRFFLLWAAGDLNMELVDPQGQVIKSDTTNELISYTEDRSGEPLVDLYLAGKWAEYHVIGPPSGSWQVKLSAADQLSENETHWILYIFQDSDILVTAGPEAPWYPVDGTVQLTAKVQAGSTPLTGAVVVANIFLPAGPTEELPLYDDGTHGDGASGDGVYSNSFIAQQFGIYRLSIKASGAWAGIPFTRTAVSEVQVASGTASISGTFSDLGIDKDDDGLFDVLRVRVPILVSDSGSFLVSGELRSSSGALLATTNAQAGLAAGQQELLLDFSGRNIWIQKGSSPFKLTNLMLLDMDNAYLPLQIDFAAAPYTTKSYDQDDFQHPAIYLTGVTSAVGIDTNDNDKYDELLIEVEVDFQNEGDFSWHGRLVDAAGTELDAYSSEAAFPPGLHTITLSFDGQRIGDSRRSGPYYLVDLEIWGAAGYAKTAQAAETEAYSFRDFESSFNILEIFLPAIYRAGPLNPGF